jgi:hypothetical protein
MNKSLLCLISTLIIVGVLFLSSCGCIKETKEEPKKAFGGKEMEIPLGWKVYENKELGIRVAYPPKVDEVVRSKSPGGALCIDFKFKDKELGDAFGFECEKIGKDFDLASYSYQHSGAKEDVTIGGKPGKMGKHEVVCREWSVAPTNVWAYAVHKGRVFEFLFEEEEPWGETGYKMLDTVEFF